MRVLLTTPPMQHFNVSGVVFRNFGPYNLAKLAGNLMDRHEVRIADYTRLRLRSNTLRSDIRGFEPQVVAMSNPFSGYTRALGELAQQVKAAFPEVILIAGGQAASAMWAHHLAQGFDFVVHGEGEVTFRALLDWLEAGGRPGMDASHLEGVAFGGPEGPTRAPARRMVADLDTLPLARRELLVPRRGLMSEGQAALAELSRGCPFHCGFCSQPGMWGRYRRRSNEAIFEELQMLARQGYTEVCFTDDTVGVDFGDAHRFPEQTAALFEMLIRAKLRLILGACMRADTAARFPELVKLAARAGLRLVNMGFESYTRNGLQALGKGENSLEINRRASEVLRGVGVLIWGSHVYGAPSQTEEDLAATVEYGPQYSDFFRMTMASPLPGSASFKKLLKEGKIREDSPLDVTYYHYTYQDGKDPKEIQRRYLWELSKYYLSKGSLSTLVDADPIKRELARQSYKGAAFFGMGKLLRSARLSDL